MVQQFLLGCCCICLGPRGIACTNWKSPPKNSLGEYYRLILNSVSLWSFSFCIDIRFNIHFSSPSSDGVCRHPYIWKEKMIEMNSGAFFTLLKVILCGFFQFIYFFLQNYCKGFLFHSLQHSVFHIWIDCINMNSL